MSNISNGQADLFAANEVPTVAANDEYDDDFEQVASKAERWAVELTGDEIASSGGQTSLFTLAEVQRADDRVHATGVLDALPAWRAADEGLRGAGGRHKLVSDRVVLVAMLLLVTEKSPLWVSEMSNLLAFRLTPEAREHLGLPPGSPSPGHQTRRERKNWYNNTRNSFQKMLSPMDPYPQRRVLHGLEARKCALDNFDAARSRVCKVRLDWFSNAFLQMSFMMQNRAIRRADMKLNISFDQTYIAPVGTGSYTPERDAERLAAATRLGTPTTPYEEKERNKILGERGVLEVFAGLYVTNADKRDDPAAASTKEWKWGWAANVAVRVTADPSTPAPFPLIVMALTFSIPNREVSEEAVLLMTSVVERGHKPGYAAADNQYFANALTDKLHEPTRALGFTPLTRYKRDRLGVRGGFAGAVQIEGEHYCPAMPSALKTASQDVLIGMIDDETYRRRVDAKTAFALRNKERPASDGSVPKMCPAYGPGATVTCPLRTIHPDSSKKIKPEVFTRDLPEAPDRICTKTSVQFKGSEGLRYAQAIPYGTQEHEDTITTARNSAEGTFGQLKHPGQENISAAARRSSRGYAAAQVFVTMLLVAFNIRRIAAFQYQLEQPKTIYPTASSVFYTPYTDKHKMLRAARRAAIIAEATGDSFEPPSRT